MISPEKIVQDYKTFAGDHKYLYKNPNGLWVIHAAKVDFDEVEVHVLTNCDNMVLHWGLFEAGNEKIWKEPPDPLPLKSKRGENNSIDTQFIEDIMMYSGHIYSVHIKLFNVKSIEPRIGGMTYVLRQHGNWYKDNNKDFFIYFT